MFYRRPGRPPEAADSRTHSIRLRVTRAEHDQYRRAAARAEGSLSVWLRGLASRASGAGADSRPDAELSDDVLPRKRDRTIRVLVTKDDLDLIRRAARRSGKSLSTWMRDTGVAAAADSVAADTEA